MVNITKDKLRQYIEIFNESYLETVHNFLQK